MTKRLEWRVCAAFCGGAALMLFAVIWWTTDVDSFLISAEQVHSDRSGLDTMRHEPMYHGDYPRSGANDLPFSELSEQYKIIGRLGILTGQFCTVRGIWREDGHFKECSERFHVTEIEGQSLDEPIIFLGSQVHSIVKKNRDRSDGTVWEVRAYESVRQVGLVAHYWEESCQGPGSGINPWRLESELNCVRDPRFKSPCTYEFGSVHIPNED